MHKILVSTIFFSFLTINAYAETCYEDRVVEGSTTCSSSGSKSADFSNSCKTTADTTVKVEVECPDTGRWVNVTADTYTASSAVPTHSQICAAKGLKAANLNGGTCASGERRPTSGTGWESINYKYGKKDDGNGGDGGQVISRKKYTTDYHCTNHGTDCSEGGTYYYSFCYDTTSTVKNDTKQDALVAVYCE